MSTTVAPTVAIVARIAELAKLRARTTPVVSVYLNTRWADEQQRERTRGFLREELRRARGTTAGPALEGALGWIEAEAEARITQARDAETQGLALFACRELGLREVVPVTLPFDDAFVMADTPYLGPLAALLGQHPTALAVFVDSESARLIPLSPTEAGDEVELRGDVPGRHRRGGWAQLAQGRYQRHVAQQRGRHLEAVADAVDEAAARGVQWLVLAGAPAALADFRSRLPDALAGRVAGTVSASRHDSAAAIQVRAGEVVARREADQARSAADDTLTEAAKGGRAVAGVEETLEAIGRGAVHRLFLLGTFAERGRLCTVCDALLRGDDGACPRCGGGTHGVELAEATLGRAIAAGGTVTLLAEHPALAEAGGVAARLRFPL